MGELRSTIEDLENAEEQQKEAPFKNEEEIKQEKEKRKEIRKSLEDKITEKLKPEGFKKSGPNWIRRDGDIVKIVCLQRARYLFEFFVEVGFCDENAMPEGYKNKKICIEACDLGGERDMIGGIAVQVDLDEKFRKMEEIEPLLSDRETVSRIRTFLEHEADRINTLNRLEGKPELTGAEMEKMTDDRAVFEFYRKHRNNLSDFLNKTGFTSEEQKKARRIQSILDLQQSAAQEKYPDEYFLPTVSLEEAQEKITRMGELIEKYIPAWFEKFAPKPKKLAKERQK